MHPRSPEGFDSGSLAPNPLRRGFGSCEKYQTYLRTKFDSKPPASFMLVYFPAAGNSSMTAFSEKPSVLPFPLPAPRRDHCRGVFKWQGLVHSQ